MSKNSLQLPDFSLEGRYRLYVHREGELIADSGWIDNLITNQGLNAIGQSVELGRYCAVGTGNNVPANTDATLQTQIAIKDGAAYPSYVRSNGVVTSPTRYGWERVTYTFPQGDVVGNVAEVGIGWTSGTCQLFSRTLVSPALSILAIDQLTVVYELRMYIPTGDVTGSLSIGGATYNYTMRAAYAATANNAGLYFGWSPFLLQRGLGARAWVAANPSLPYFGALSYGGPAVIGSVENGLIYQSLGGPVSPNSAAHYNSSVTNSAYVDGSGECSFTLTWGIAHGNNPGGGIQGIIYSAAFGTYQVVFDAPIPKDDTKVLTLIFRQGWTRRV